MNTNLFIYAKRNERNHDEFNQATSCSFLTHTLIEIICWQIHDVSFACVTLKQQLLLFGLNEKKNDSRCSHYAATITACPSPWKHWAWAGGRSLQLCGGKKTAPANEWAIYLNGNKQLHVAWHHIKTQWSRMNVNSQNGMTFLLTLYFFCQSFHTHLISTRTHCHHHHHLHSISTLRVFCGGTIRSQHVLHYTIGRISSAWTTTTSSFEKKVVHSACVGAKTMVAISLLDGWRWIALLYIWLLSVKLPMQRRIARALFTHRNRFDSMKLNRANAWK